MTDSVAGRQGPNVGPRASSPKAEFRALFEAEFDFVCRSLRRLGVRDADVHDVAQELFVTVNGALPTYERSRPLRPWLFAFAARFAANYRRLGWHDADVLSEDAPLPSPRLAEKLTARVLVARGLDALDFDKRVALVMHDLEGIPAPEIAQELDVPLNTVYSRVRLARVGFKKRLRELEAQERTGEAKPIQSGLDGKSDTVEDGHAAAEEDPR